MNKAIKAVMPKSYTLNTMEKPMHAGEIYHLWESLTTSHQIISIVETFLMNSEDKKLHLMLQGMTTGTTILRINKLEGILKDAGFTVPPRSASKILQGKPGVGQEVKLSDEEVIKVLYNYMISVLSLDGRGICTVTTDQKIRDVFIDLLNEDMKAHELILNLGMERNALLLPPYATSSPKSLTMGEVYWLWFELNLKITSIVLLESFEHNTSDAELKAEINNSMKKIAYPHLEQIEAVLKREGFTVPSRPLDRTRQQPQNRSNKIVMQDNEIVSLMITTAQMSISNHIRSYAAAFRSDVKMLFKSFITSEIDYLERLLKLALKRSMLNIPPFVTSKRG